MPPLNELQAGLSRSIHAGDARAACAKIQPPRAADGRLRIHRHHHYISLTAALAATYPVVARLVGERCFGGLAREFILLAPPASPCLFEYGNGLARYLAAVPTLMELPYLPDVARLEWAVNEARHAPDAPRLPAEALTPPQDCCFSGVVFALHPSCRLVASPYPIDRIWRANQPDADPADSVSLAEGATRLLVYRDGDDDVVWCRLFAGEFQFLRALAEEGSLARAWDAATRVDAFFDGSRALSGLVRAGVIADVRFPAPQA